MAELLITDIYQASEAVGKFQPVRVGLTDGSAVFIHRMNHACWQSVWEELKDGAMALFGSGPQTGKIGDFPMAILKLAAYSTVPKSEFKPDKAIERIALLDETWDHADVIGVGRVAFKVNYTAEDVKNLTGFFGDVLEAIQNAVPQNSLPEAASSEPESVPNRATRRRSAKLENASSSRDATPTA